MGTTMSPMDRVLATFRALVPNPSADAWLNFCRKVSIPSKIDGDDSSAVGSSFCWNLEYNIVFTGVLAMRFCCSWT